MTETPTPLTDATEQECYCMVNGAIINAVVTAAFARSLERQLAAANHVWMELSVLVSCSSSDGSAELDQVKFLQEHLTRLIYAVHGKAGGSYAEALNIADSFADGGALSSSIENGVPRRVK